MIVKFQASLEEITQAQTRYFLRTKTARRNRLESTFGMAFGCALALFIVFYKESPHLVVPASVVGGLSGAAIGFWTYIPLLKQRLRTYFKTDYGKLLPSESACEVAEGKFRYTLFGATVEFSLSDLKSLTREPAQAELSFGEKGLCILPYHAFGSDAEREAFLEALEPPQTAQ